MSINIGYLPPRTHVDLANNIIQNPDDVQGFVEVSRDKYRPRLDIHGKKTGHSYKVNYLTYL